MGSRRETDHAQGNHCRRKSQGQILRIGARSPKCASTAPAIGTLGRIRTERARSDPSAWHPRKKDVEFNRNAFDGLARDRELRAYLFKRHNKKFRAASMGTKSGFSGVDDSWIERGTGRRLSERGHRQEGDRRGCAGKPSGDPEARGGDWSMSLCSV